MKKTGQIAICSMMAALSMVIMLLTGLIPMAEFALPAIAGILLVPVVTEVGWGAGWLTYGAVSLLSLILAPSKECALYYLLFLGCYPLLKSKLEHCRSRVVEWVLKFLIFNILAAGIAALAIWVFAFPGYEELLKDAPLVIAAGWLFLNGVFLVYDIAVTRLITGYVRYFRPKYLRKFFH